MHPSEKLFSMLGEVEPYPIGVKKIETQIKSCAFFPGGYGLYMQPGEKIISEFPFGKIMVLGKDFDSEENYNRTLNNPQNNQSSGMWKNIKPVFSRNGINLLDCFFSNVYMGLRKGNNSEGVFPGETDSLFVKRCSTFLLKQLDFQKPRLIITLGVPASEFVSRISDNLRSWNNARTTKDIDNSITGPLVKNVYFRGIQDYSAIVLFLTHFGRYYANVKHRNFKGKSGQDCEAMLISEAISCLPR